MTRRGDGKVVVKSHTVVVGSGAAGLNAAVQLKRRGIDVCLVTEGLSAGTSINTGSDKQTYYKLGLYGGERDSVRDVAETLFGGGATDGDTAMVEAAVSARGFYNLLELGVPFPQDRFGQFPGYKTDHDPRQRATSIGPYTSREMCRVLIDEARRLGIDIREGRFVFHLLTLPTQLQTQPKNQQRVCGVVALDTTPNSSQPVEVYLCDHVVWATGGPGGMYRDSVYPPMHCGSLGVPLAAGARGQSLAESQFGLASTAFRWNVSGTYMQAIPRFVSTAPDGVSDPREFLLERLGDAAAVAPLVFLKGYQWPFDVKKSNVGGSSTIDLLVYDETVRHGRRVFLDFRKNITGFDAAQLTPEVREYWQRSGIGDASSTPLERLAAMNPQAITHYRERGIDLANEPLEIALCVQHNNGGLAVNAWWESVNIASLFVAGEAAGTHGVTRPGGAALNAGQVAGFRIAEFLAATAPQPCLTEADHHAALAQAEAVIASLDTSGLSQKQCDWDEIAARMTAAAGAVVTLEGLDVAVDAARKHCSVLASDRQPPRDAVHLRESLRVRQLALAHLVYLEAIRFSVSRTGSRGSRLLVAGDMMLPEDEAWRTLVIETQCETQCEDLCVTNTVRQRRPLPESNAWFETAWSDYCAGRIFEPIM